MIKWYKAAVDGSRDTEIHSGDIGSILPEIFLIDQAAGKIYTKKFYIENTGATELASTLTLTGASVFTTVIFESTGDGQTEGDLSGSEGNESPINVVLPAGTHKSFWCKVTVPQGSTETDNYNTVRLKLSY